MLSSTLYMSKPVHVIQNAASVKTVKEPKGMFDDLISDV